MFSSRRNLQGGQRCGAARSFPAITNVRTPLGVQGLVGGHAMPADVRNRTYPRHAGRVIGPDGRYAAEERGGGLDSNLLFVNVL